MSSDWMIVLFYVLVSVIAIIFICIISYLNDVESDLKYFRGRNRADLREILEFSSENFNLKSKIKLLEQQLKEYEAKSKKYKLSIVQASSGRWFVYMKSANGKLSRCSNGYDYKSQAVTRAKSISSSSGWKVEEGN